MATRNTNRILVGVTYLFLALALVTLIPYSSTKTNDFGYRSLCPFAPWSTLALLFGAGLTQAIRKYVATQAD